jgi:hypothetical protein
MYLIYCIELLVFVYIAPALAVWPRLVQCSTTAIAIPFLSIIIIAFIKTALVFIGEFSQTVILFISVGFTFMAVYRVKNVLIKSRLDWPKEHLTIIAINLIISLYFFVKLSVSSFDTHDEIYSWNMWAVQHYYGEPIDYYYTQSAYPQLFSVLIAYCYKVLGNIELQLPVKALLAIFPFSMLTAIGIAPKETSNTNVARYFVIMLLLVLGTGIKKFFYDGLADPMMAAALTVSVFLFIRYQNEMDRTDLLWLSVLCGIASAYTKQPALIWILISFPVISLISVAVYRGPKVMIVAAGILVASGLIWVFGSGIGFYMNQGVINASQQGREVSEQLVFAINSYFVQKPFILLLFVMSIISIIRARRYGDIFLFLLMPSLVAWFLFGAYSLRLGIHVVCLAALLLTATNYKLPFLEVLKIWERIGALFQRKILLLTLLVVVVSALAASKSIRKIDEEFDLYEGGKNTIYKYFGDHAAFIYNKIYNNPDILLWIPSNYIYGIFYGHNKVIRPDYASSPKYTIEHVISEIKAHRPDYLFYSGPTVAYGPGSHLLYELAEKRCPYLFEKVAGPPNKFGYIVYRLQKDEMLMSQCR